MIDFSDHKTTIEALDTAKEVEKDRREIMKECNTFVTKKDGQWEQGIWDLFGQYKRPRYTLDLCKPVIHAIYGELTDNEFNISVTPMGSGAQKDVAKVYSGLVKNVEAMSNATDVYDQAAKKAITSGYSCFRIDQDYADCDAFDQDLFIRSIHDALDRVWFLGNFQRRTCEDADAVVVEHLVSSDEYEERFGKEEMAMSLGDSECRNVYYYKRQGIKIGELIYKQKVKKTLYQMPDGMVLSEEDANNSGADLKGVKTRVRETYKIMVRFFDGNRFLNEPEETVFDYLPVIPVLPNFEIVEDKPISSGCIEWLMDAQRIRNYAASKYVEDVALSPKAKPWMTKGQAAGHERQLSRMNTSNDPVQFYTHVDGQLPPFIPGQVTPNPATADLIMMSAQSIEQSSAIYAANLGDNPALQSGVAIDKIQDKGNLGTMEYFKAMKAAISHAGKIIVNAMPKLYDTAQERRIIKDDGTDELVSINQVSPNGEVINDLSSGIYDVFCDVGPAFRNRQEKTAEQIVKLGQVDPSIVSRNKDILLSSLNSPGMDLAAERERAALMKMGEIPESQWTDEEREAAAVAAQQPPPEDPMMVAAKAEDKKADAALAAQEMKAIQLQQAQQKMDFEQQKQQIELVASGQKDQMQMQVDTMNMLKTMAEILKTIGESGEKDVTLEPEAKKAYTQQAQRVSEVQEQL